VKHGFDFGLKPTVMVLGDMECAVLEHGGNPKAMGYGRLPEFGLLPAPPFAAVLFENVDKGTEFFRHLKGWSEASGDSDAVSLSFIEPDQGGYVVCVYPDLTLLTDRCVPKYLQSETTQVLSFPILFPLTVDEISDNYRWFKEQVAESPFVFGAARANGSLVHETLFVKRRVAFYSQRDVPSGSPEETYFKRGRAADGEGEFSSNLPVDSPEAIRERRRRRMKTLLPIALARLRAMHSFEDARGTLAAKGYVGWQVEQAACNTVVSQRTYRCLHYEGAGDKPPHVSILDHLLTTYDDPLAPMPSESDLAAALLEEQIRLDSLELLRHLDSDAASQPHADIQGLLGRRGLLSDDVGQDPNS